MFNRYFYPKSLRKYLFNIKILFHDHHQITRFNSKSIKNISLFPQTLDFSVFNFFNTVRTFSSSSSQFNPPKTENLNGPLTSRLIEKLPPTLKIYAKLMRLDKPTGTWLLLLPCWWSIGLSTISGLPSSYNMILFAIGAILMRSAGCIINDIWDRKFDSNVQRTKYRPLASNQISIMDSIALLSCLLGLSLLILIQFDLQSIKIGMLSLILVVSYPSFKRFTYWPQVILGMTFNWGILLGWSVNTNGHLDYFATLPLYMAGICWTMIYDTIYAHQDKYDDLLLGLKSTALKFGSKTPIYLNGFATLMTACLISAGLHTEQTWPFYLSVITIFGKLLMINSKLDINSTVQCAQAFKQNASIGGILLLGIIASTWYKKYKQQKKDDNVENNTNIAHIA